MAAAAVSAAAQLASGPASARTNCPAAVIGFFLALRVGVGKQAADGQQQNGAQAQTQPCRNQQARGFAHGNGGHEKKKERQSARPPVCAADGKQHQNEQRKEDVDAQSPRPSIGPAGLTSRAYIDCSRLATRISSSQFGVRSSSTLDEDRSIQHGRDADIGSSFMLVVDAHHCRNVSFAHAGGSAGAEHAADQRPPARNTLQCARAAH